MIQPIDHNTNVASNERSLSGRQFFILVVHYHTRQKRFLTVATIFIGK